MKPTSLNWIVGALLAATAAVASAGPLDPDCTAEKAAKSAAAKATSAWAAAATRKKPCPTLRRTQPTLATRTKTGARTRIKIRTRIKTRIRTRIRTRTNRRLPRVYRGNARRAAPQAGDVEVRPCLEIVQGRKCSCTGVPYMKFRVATMWAEFTGRAPAGAAIVALAIVSTIGGCRADSATSDPAVEKTSASTRAPHRNRR